MLIQEYLYFNLKLSDTGVPMQDENTTQPVALPDLYAELVKHFGGQVKAAAAIGVTQSTISEYVTGKSKMGPVTAIKAERETNGKFKSKALCPALATVAA